MGTSSTDAVEIDDQEGIDSLKPDSSDGLVTAPESVELSSSTASDSSRTQNVKQFRPYDELVLDRAEPLKEQFEVLANWEGVVTAVEGSSFFADMRSRSSEHELPEEDFEIDLDNVDEGDQDLVREGGVFYLTVGIRRAKGEGSAKTTRVVFRRMPRWSVSDIERSEAEAERLWIALQSGISSGEASS